MQLLRRRYLTHLNPILNPQAALPPDDIGANQY
jgi:hypothetical protein